MKQKINKFSTIVFWIIITIGILVRIYHFPNAIAEMNIDEIMTAVNAKSIIERGITTDGLTFPVYLMAWGGQSVVLLYSITIIMKIIGPSLLAVRLPMLLISIISMFVFYDLMKKLTKNKVVALIALSLVAISPWHMLQSIWSLDCNMFPHFLLIAIDIFYTGIVKKNKKMIYVSMIFFAITLYCYGVAIYFTPLFLFIMSIYVLKIKEVKLIDVVICVIIFSLVALPIVTMFAMNVLKIENNIHIGLVTIPYYENLSRTKDIVFFAPDIMEQFIKNVISTAKILIFQADESEWNASILFGTVYHVSIIFIIIGIITVFKNVKKEKTGYFMLLIWGAMSVLTGFIINEANVNRINSVWYVCIILTSIGIYRILQQIRNKKIFFYIVSFIYSILFISYILYFNTTYYQTIENSACFSKGYCQALTYVKNLKETEIFYENVQNDGVIFLYTVFNKDKEKRYNEIKDEEELMQKIKNLKENEVIIVHSRFKQYGEGKNQYEIGDYIIIKK